MSGAVSSCEPCPRPPGRGARHLPAGAAIASDAGRPLPPAGIAHVDMAEVRYERDELTAAPDNATEGVRLCRQLAYTLPLLAGLAILARIRQAQGDAPGALAALAEALTLAAPRATSGVPGRRPAAARELRLLE